MSNTASARRAPQTAPTDPMAQVRSRADALYRAALECCRQHDRSAKLSSSSEDPELEHDHLDALCRMCDGSLTEMANAYTAAAAHVHPARDEAWWHKANALWHASREYARRHAGCDDLSRRLSARHDAERLSAMQLEYELEASALLALRHAAEAYRRTRPELGQPAAPPVRTFLDALGARWQVTLGKESWGTLVLIFSPAGAGGVRTSIMQAETMFQANAELDALTDDDIRARLAESRPWT